MIKLYKDMDQGSETVQMCGDPLTLTTEMTSLINGVYNAIRQGNAQAAEDFRMAIAGLAKHPDSPLWLARPMEGTSICAVIPKREREGV